MTEADAARMGRRTRQDAPGEAIAKPSKYRNVRVVVDGHTFDSKREAAIYQELKARMAAGEVRELRLQVKFPLFAPVMRDSEQTEELAVVAHYVADFVFEERGDRQLAVCGDEPYYWNRVVADCKGGRNTQMFALKKKWLLLQQGIEIRELR